MPAYGAFAPARRERDVADGLALGQPHCDLALRRREAEGRRHDLRSDNRAARRVNPQTRQGADRDGREFQQTVTIGGHEEQSYGTACRDKNGDWKLFTT